MRSRFAFATSAVCRRAWAFTLVELLTVMAVILVLLALVAPAVKGIKGSGDVTKAAYDLAGTLENARTYAMTNNTYTWVGFYEEAPSSFTAPNNPLPPPYTGKGRLVIATVASKDGTMIIDDGQPAHDLDAARLSQLGKLQKIEGVHMTSIGAPVPAAGARPDSLAARSDLPYNNPDVSGVDPAASRLDSDSAMQSSHAFTAQSYKFYKTIRFNPRGEAVVNTRGNATNIAADTIWRVAEIGLRPARGAVPDMNSPDLVAIQFTGTSGSVSIYRR